MKTRELGEIARSIGGKLIEVSSEERVSGVSIDTRTLNPSDLFLGAKVYGELGQLANFAEKTGDRLRRMLAS